MSENKVKPLEWRAIEVARTDADPMTEPTGDYEAQSQVGAYSIEMYFGTDSYGWAVYDRDDNCIGDCDTPEGAMKAAQDHFNALILSALIPETHTED